MTGRISNATRYLCAAAYLDPKYANQVIGELVASHRAVVPSLGIDLGMIIRHCLHARRIQLIRDLLLTVLVLGGLYLATVPTIAIMIIAFFLGFLPSATWERRSVGGKFVVVVCVGFALITAGVLWLIIKVFGQAVPGAPHLGPLATGRAITFAVVAFLVLTAMTEASYSYIKYQTLGERLRPEADPLPLHRSQGRIESRIAEIEAAQWGNLTLYSGENPFIGTGGRGRAWSIAIELDRAPDAGKEFWGKPGSRGYVTIDPVELHGVIRDRLLRLKDQGLPENERVSALVVEDHVVGEGQRRWDGPLVDPASRIPYSIASREAIDALIRHPQAGLRYYQRVSVSDEGQSVWSGEQEVIGIADQEIAASAFVYLAVEGHMFYLEFVSTVLPPVQRRYHVVDLLPNVSPGRFLAKVLLDSASTAFRDMISAPFRACGTLLLIMREGRSFEDEVASVGDYLLGDVGARLSVRELGAANAPHTYIQRLDAAKYTKIVERLIIDTVLDFLVAKGADATAYRNSAYTVINSGVVISGGNVTGPVAAGVHAVAQAVAQAQPAATVG
jgi:hypothetical protein